MVDDNEGISGFAGPDIAWTADPAGNIIAVMQLERG